MYKANINRLIVGDLKSPLTSMDRSYRQKVNKETSALNDTLNYVKLIDIYRTFHPKAAVTHSSQVHVEHSPGQITC